MPVTWLDLERKIGLPEVKEIWAEFVFAGIHIRVAPQTLPQFRQRVSKRMSQESDASRSGEISYSQSVTEWINEAKHGDARAAQQIWDRYIAELIRVANKKLGHTNRRVADEEDVVVEAFRSFFSRLEKQGFSRLDDRDDLWQVLVMLTERRAIDQIRRHHRPDDRTRLVSESFVGFTKSESGAAGLDYLPGSCPTPETVGETLEEFRRRLNSLNDELLERIAIEKMSGKKNIEIADELGIGLRSIERKLALIRKIWSRESADD